MLSSRQRTNCRVISLRSCTGNTTWIVGVALAAVGGLEEVAWFMGVAAQSCYVRALSTADASLMGLIDYVRLPLAIFFGWLIFSETPDVFMLVGAAIIIGSTVYITWREAQVKTVISPDKEIPS